MSGRKVYLVAATMTAIVWGVSSAAAEVNIIYGCCGPKQQAQTCAADGCSFEQEGITVIYGRQPVAYVAQPIPEPYYVVNQGPTYDPAVLPYDDGLYDYPYVPVYGYPGYRPFGPGGYRPFGHRGMRHDMKRMHGMRHDMQGMHGRSGTHGPSAARPHMGGRGARGIAPSVSYGPPRSAPRIRSSASPRMNPHR